MVLPMAQEATASRVSSFVFLFYLFVVIEFTRAGTPVPRTLESRLPTCVHAQYIAFRMRNAQGLLIRGKTDRENFISSFLSSQDA